ncbi:MAG: hypothetical protein CMN76_08715 [Spirochaetaceae bacterium]|nr:hypothetical protein [Spirochaetaceae bacterium]|tara:strand:+ start:60397 stop:60708 length:312 start_codon:yes stop_codon:yes gene_type:complete
MKLPNKSQFRKELRRITDAIRLSALFKFVDQPPAITSAGSLHLKGDGYTVVDRDYVILVVEGDHVLSFRRDELVQALARASAGQEIGPLSIHTQKQRGREVRN